MTLTTELGCYGPPQRIAEHAGGSTIDDSKLREAFQPDNYPRLYNLLIEQQKKPRCSIPLSIIVKMLYSVWIQSEEYSK
ncbi:hypothetical protein DI09_3p310 [Mitosporidium daphniae]|uniref:Gag1-like clamp domain-containing protein n=1 Tax=Mitosporidium daphniae TaxID=1485682 RepID=A0A098VR19_9MICR|nr:uncharacterized protein DI09_3p310 [Mitosporidium daphniae]KGG51269.1 hypothetical protein DI09_3p310 [Mitosporidium daphniae]|eukprot:XP_013237696.1 uncharacterized protein DI09_3p310 [Mitosporidium daphniae]